MEQGLRRTSVALESLEFGSETSFLLAEPRGDSDPDTDSVTLRWQSLALAHVGSYGRLSARFARAAFTVGMGKGPYSFYQGGT